MDDYVYQQHLALPCSNPNVSLGLFSDGIPPAYDQLQNDPFFIQSDQQSFQKFMINEGFHQFDPFYDSLDLPLHSSPVSPNALQVCGRHSFESCESVVTECFESPLLWNDAFVNNGLDTGVQLICQETYQPVQVISDSDSKEFEIVQSDNNGLKNESEQSVLPKRARKRSAKQMKQDDKNLAADLLTWEIVSQYFYMPIAHAARELNIGLTHFKKRCRELGVRRWPHRKLMSIQSLIKNVKEMENDGGMDSTLSKVTIRNAIQELEYQRKLIESMPDVELEAQTKRLRQACFKANYKRRRLMIMNSDGIDKSSGSSNSNHGDESNDNGFSEGQDSEECDELKSLLFDALSPSDCTFLNDSSWA